MAAVKMSIEECLKEADRYTTMGLPLQAKVWMEKAAEVKAAEGSKRMKRWMKKVVDGKVVYSEWLEWAKECYTVEETCGGYKVVSSCHSGKEWMFDYEADALEKVWKLVGWKEHDRARGRGCMVKDVSDE